LGRTFNPAWVLAPIFVLILADWTENLVQLGQLKRYLDGIDVQESWIKIASIATTIKMLFLYGTWAILGGLALLLIIRAFKSA
jgi:hypothetical protein